MPRVYNQPGTTSPSIQLQMNKSVTDTTALLEELRSLEIELHKDRSRKRMEALLHPDFVEFGRSGKAYTRDEILNEFATDATLPVVQPRHFAVALLAEGIALLTYVSAHVNADGTTDRHTLRSSIWVKTELGWRMRFHQGTSTTPAMFDQK